MKGIEPIGESEEGKFAMMSKFMGNVQTVSKNETPPITNTRIIIRKEINPAFFFVI